MTNDKVVGPRCVYMTQSAERLLADSPNNALVGWLLLVFLAGVVAESLATGDLAWAVFVAGVLGLCIAPPIVFRDPEAMLPWEVIALAALPTFGRAVATFELTSDINVFLSVAALALIVAVELDLLTDVQLTVGFAIAFVVLATLATAGAWAVFRWSMDTVVGTQFLLKPGVDSQTVHDELMGEFVYSAVAGVLAGVVFELYFRRRASPGERVPPEVSDA
jgi:small basic protein